MGEETTLILIRFICSIVSMLFCSVIIILYLCLFIYNSKSNNQINRFNSSKEKNVLSSQLTLPAKKVKQNTKQGKVIHFIFLLTLSNFLFGLTNIWIYVSYRNNFLDKTNKSLQCSLLAFLSCFFDLSSLCWITSLAKLFFSSTIHTEYSPYKEKRLVICYSFYSIMFPFLIACIPLINVSYSFVGTHCALDYGNCDIITRRIMIGVNLVFIGYNLIDQTVKMYKISKFYKEKKFITKINSDDKASSIKWYIIIFTIFPIYLILSRGIIGFNNLLLIKTELIGDLGFKVFNYLGSILSCLNGTFTVILCLYFFKSVLCCGNTSENNNAEMKSTSEDGDDTNDINFQI
jgi:hypothetical protein